MNPKLATKFLATGRTLEMFVYTSRMIHCRKVACKQCPHGPYWYAVYREGRKVKSIYLGRHLPEELKIYVE